MAQNIQLFVPREGFLTHQWITTGNKLITDKYYDEAKMRTRQERVATDTGDPLGAEQHHWNTGAKKKKKKKKKQQQHLNPGGPSNRKKKAPAQTN